MSLALKNPQIKFQTDLETRTGLERIADFHRLGGNGPSANEVMKLVATQISKIPAKEFLPALAALSDYQKGASKPKSRRSTIQDQIGI